MTELDLEIPGLAEEIIEEYGKLIAYQLFGVAEYDVETSTMSPAGGEVFACKAIVEPYRGQRMMAGLVEAGDYKITIAATNFPDAKPSTEDKAFVDNDEYKVKNVMATYSGDLIAIYELQVGK